jgi:hypothetical protein
MDERPRQPQQPYVTVRDESMILPLARQVAARHGDPDPEWIQHARGTREEVTTTTGSIVHSDAASYIIVIKGNFRARTRSPPFGADTGDFEYPFQILVVDVETGAITDSGNSPRCPDLTTLGNVVTDYRAG